MPFWEQWVQEPRHDVEIESLTQSSSMNRLLNDCVYCACLFHCLIFLQPFFVFELDDAIKYLQVLPNLVVNSAGDWADRAFGARHGSQCI